MKQGEMGKKSTSFLILTSLKLLLTILCSTLNISSIYSQNTVSIHQGAEKSGFYNLRSDGDYEIIRNSALNSLTTISFSFLNKNKNNKKIKIGLFYNSNISITQHVDQNIGNGSYSDSIEYNFQQFGVQFLFEKKINQSNKFDILAFAAPSLAYLFSIDNNGWQSVQTIKNYIDSKGQQITTTGFNKVRVEVEKNISRLLLGLKLGLRIQKSINESFAISIKNGVDLGISNVPESYPYSSLGSFFSQLGLVYHLKR
tara:strand:+ start:1410 stop:2177 length:768 start_codon:yes stop_codon:yes gene_type:complete